MSSTRRRKKRPTHRRGTGSTLASTTTATTITRLLHARYKDYFTTAELQITKAPGRVDFLAVRPSLAHPEIHAFEIKVSRADFLKDNKWPTYLDGCKQFWFVTAAGIVDKEEIPPEAGWIEASKNAARLFIRKKAPAHPLPEANEAHLFRRIVHREYYGHCNIAQNGGQPDRARAERLAAWVAAKEDRRTLAFEVNRKIRAAFDEQEARLRIERDRNDGLEHVARFLEDRNIEPAALRNPRSPQFLENLLRKVDPGLFDDAGEQTIKALSRAARHVEQAATQQARQLRAACDHLLDELEKAKDGGST